MAEPLTSRVYHLLNSYRWQIPSALLFFSGAYFIRKSFSKVDRPAVSEATLAETTAKCRFNISNDTSSTISLPDGRKLGYAEYGSRTGRAIFFLHGWPGSRIEAVHLDGLGKKLGARIISVDRPGFGWSSPQPERTMLDHPKDIDHLATHLKLDHYGVMGVSGGGPHALACAYALPRDKLKAVSIIVGLGPPDIGTRGMAFPNWLGWSGGFRFTTICKWYWQYDITARLDLSDEERLERLKREFSKSKPPQKDVEIMKDDDFWRVFLRSSREAFGQGLDGPMNDARLMVSDFGFRVEDIRKDLPVRLWYGSLDTNVPANYGVQIAKRLGANAQLTIADETHSSTFVVCKERAVEALVRSISAGEGTTDDNV